MGLTFLLALLIAVPLPLLAQNQTDTNAKSSQSDKDKKDNTISRVLAAGALNMKEILPRPHVSYPQSGHKSAAKIKELSLTQSFAPQHNRGSTSAFPPPSRRKVRVR
jgi:hypothetical protein